MTFLAFIVASLVTGTIVTVPGVNGKPETTSAIPFKPRFDSTQCPACLDFLLNIPSECKQNQGAVRECESNQECFRIEGIDPPIQHLGSELSPSDYGYVCTRFADIGSMKYNPTYRDAKFVKQPESGSETSPPSKATTKPTINPPTDSAPDPVDGGWTTYGNWSTCSDGCGGGTQTRGRTCNNPEPANGGKVCEGDGTDLQSCNIQLCPIGTPSVEVTNKVVLRGTPTTLTCSLTEITRAVDVSWWDDGTKLINGNKYSIKEVAFSAGTQGSELTVNSPGKNKTYTCKVHDSANELASKVVQLKTYIGTPSVEVTNKVVLRETPTTLTCSLTELTETVDVSWWDGNTKLINGNKYSIKEVAFSAGDGTQGSELTVNSPVGKNKTYTCKVDDSLDSANKLASTAVQLETYKCHKTCKWDKCTGPGHPDCTECEQGNKLLNDLCTEICTPGNYFNAKKECTMCDENTYNDVENSMSCTECPGNKTSATGSDSEDDCTEPDEPEEEPTDAGVKGQAEAVFFVTTVWLFIKFNY